jgi:hypothetical protein
MEHNNGTEPSEKEKGVEVGEPEEPTGACIRFDQFLREGRRGSCMHARTPPSRLFRLDTRAGFACLRFSLGFHTHTIDGHM